MTKFLLDTHQGLYPQAFAADLKSIGVSLVHIPLIQTVPTECPWPHQDFDWVFFTSGNSVAYFPFQRLKKALKVAAIGRQTAKKLQTKGIKVDFISQKSYSEAFLAEWQQQQTTPQRILLPQSQKARHIIKNELTLLGSTVTEYPLYDTVFPASSRQKLSVCLKARQLDYGLFASGSAWQHYVQVLQALGQSHDGRTYFSIGPTTTGQIEKSGGSVLGEAPSASMESLQKWIIKELSK